MKSLFGRIPQGHFRMLILSCFIAAILIALSACGPEASQESFSISFTANPSDAVSTPIPSGEFSPAPSAQVPALPNYPEKPMEILRVSGIMISPPEAEPLAPYTFYIKDDCIYIPHTLTNTVGIYRNGQLVDEWQNTVGNGIAVMGFVNGVFYTISASDIEEESGILCRWDQGRIVNSSIATNRHEDGILNSVQMIRDRNGEILLQYATGEEILVSDTGETRRLDEYSFQFLENGISATSNDTGAVFQMSGKHEPSGAFPIGHGAGIVYFEYAETYVTEDGFHRMLRNVFQFAEDGALINVFPMLEYWDYVPNNGVCIDRHHIFQLYTENDQVVVLELSPAEVKPPTA